MRILPIKAEDGREITDFGSHGVVGSRIARAQSETSIAVLRFSPGGTLADHPAVGSQLFIVIQGKGWVRAEKTGQFSVQAGQAVFWEAGEVHASGSEDGMTAIVIEAENLGTY